MSTIKLPSNENNDSHEFSPIEKSALPEDVLEDFLNELKSPLTSIKGWVKILSNDSDKELHPRALESISTIIGKIEHVEKQIREYLSNFKKRNKS